MEPKFKIGILILLILKMLPTEILACSCNWEGSFLKLAPQSPIIIRGIVKKHTTKSFGGNSAASVEILEVFKGELKEKTIRIDGDNGMLCRVAIERFHPGSEYIFAINGPGSKPAYDNGFSISSCGQYWLKVENNKVIGSIAKNSVNSEIEEMSLEEFRFLLNNTLNEKRDIITLYGELKSGEEYMREFARQLVFILEAQPLGWLIKVKQANQEEDLSRLSPPLHFGPNPREIEGWHLRNSDNTGPNEAGEKNQNTPGVEREFIFSPEVGKSIDGPDANEAPSPADIEKISRFGRGYFTILDYRLSNTEAGKQAGFDWIKFRVNLLVPPS
ncbi:MAG: hypothetical protein GYA55_03200 [SAR324 cluster bacterium]|uniref:Uncharacterized protein n=1 Tax=SAR324 cluster bacterium TaxID=2024889 RepID=A0A7X9FPV9_9DELT|nr:hypothetical protein [SAR324 cluster bacterium]